MAISIDATLGNGSHRDDFLEVDALIVGAGFSGCLLLYKLRQELGLNAKIIEAGSGLGGTWQNNRYPGARVDCPVPGYELSIGSAWKNWTWKEKYPGYEELQAYFAHLDRELSLSKDCLFNTKVVSAQFKNGKWTVSTHNGQVARAKYLIPAIGFAAKSYTPDWKGLEEFRGDIYHSSAWPRNGVNVRGKRVAVIGTGSTGIQIIQQWAKEAETLYVFQRTPNTSLPMRQENLPLNQQDATYTKKRHEIFTRSASTFGGLPYDYIGKDTFDESPSERQATYERLYAQGGLAFWNGSYQDLMTNMAANREAYRFWAQKTRARINDPKLKDLLAPLEPQHPFGAKRPSLEQDFYEQFNQPHVHLVDARATPISGLAPTGIVTRDMLYEVDIIAIATGFDSITGGIEGMGIKDINGAELSHRWSQGVSSYLGMVVSGCPNMFLPYSAHSPSVFSNGPTSIELQACWIADIIRQMESQGIQSIDVREAVEEDWIKEVMGAAENTLFVKTNSWYMGGNIPGKRIEPLFFMGGLPRYRQKCQEALDNKLKDFNISFS
jgi:cation diffusion facilitator CzcD-associated flavoprotein CzcO